MKKLLLLFYMLTGFLFVMAQDYTPSFTGTRTSTNRAITAISLASPSYPNHSANTLSLTSTEKTQCWVDKSSDIVMKVGAGETVGLTISYDGDWMNTYAYVDTDNNGFTASIVDGSNYLPAGDLVAYSFYNNNATSDANGWNSDGSAISGNNRSKPAMPSFIAPETQGTYRMRIKLDWCNIDPAGDQDGKYGDFMANGGHIVDVTLEVAEKQVSRIFRTTTIENNEFADNTTWYTLQIGATGLVIDNNGNADHIALDDYISEPSNEAQLWAFTGDNTNGYRIYNKEAGTSKVLAAPTTMNGKTGNASHPILVDADNIPSGYIDMWLFTSSLDITGEGNYYYMAEKGYPANKVNNRDGKLAFWNEGADAGSTLNVRVASAEYRININDGEWSKANAEKSWASEWKSINTPYITLSVATNNMTSYNDNGDIQLFTCLDDAATNGVNSSVYTITAAKDYSIIAYSFDFVSSGTDDITITPIGGEPVSANATTAQSINFVAEEETNAVQFTVSASSAIFANTSNFYVQIIRNTPVVEPSADIFITNSGAIPYRIPAIATAYNGDLIAVADYRHSGADIGMVNNGRIDLHARISNDNGSTWNEKFSVVDGQGGNSPDFMHVGFGDPCIVADRESSRVLILSCAGNVSFPSGTRNNHQNIARFYSENNGKTWSEPVDIADPIYAMFDNSTNHGSAKAMFIGSGKIHQSRYVKVDEYYRLYCAVLMRNASETYVNFVLYSDNFGDTWDVLGGVETSPIPNDANEPKVEELPNGNIVISSRCNGGRHFNIFTFTDAEKAEGSWGVRATSNSSVNGTVAVNNSCNGEIMILPVIRKEDNKEMWIALQSLPFGSGRTNVGIYYKELASESDYDTPANFAKDWDGRYQSSIIGSAYSTMCLQKDNTIAFLYEESTYGADYTIKYKNYTVEQITNDTYSLDWNRLVVSQNSLVPMNVTPDKDSEVETLDVISLTFAKEFTIDETKSITLTGGDDSNIEIKVSINTENNKVLDITVKEGLEIGDYVLNIEEGALNAIDNTFNPVLNYRYNVNYSIDTFVPTSILPANKNTVESLKSIVLDFSPEVPGRIIDTSVINVTDANGKIVTTGSLSWGTSFNAVNIELADEITENGEYTITIPYGSIWNNKWSGGPANGGRCIPETTLIYTVDNATGINNVDAEEKETVMYDLTGRRVYTVTAPGIYIVNGKKIILK